VSKQDRGRIELIRNALECCAPRVSRRCLGPGPLGCRVDPFDHHRVEAHARALASGACSHFRGVPLQAVVNHSRRSRPARERDGLRECE
jgi:hypothetical protein